MRDSQYIKRIIKYCKRITQYTKDINSKLEFTSNDLIFDAVLLNLEQIGETAKKLSCEQKKIYSDINWKAIIGLRNLISHEYEGIETEIIYYIATIEVRNLLNYLTLE